MYDTNDEYVIRHLRAAKDRTAKPDKAPGSALRDFYRRAVFTRLRTTRAYRGPEGLPEITKPSPRQLKVGNQRILTDFNLRPFIGENLEVFEPSKLDEVILSADECNTPARASGILSTAINSYDKDYVVLGNREITCLATEAQLLELEQTGKVYLNYPLMNCKRPTYYQITRLEDYHIYVKELDALFPRVRENIYFVPKDVARQMVLYDYTQDVPINLAKFLYIASVGGIKSTGATRFLSASEYFYHFRVFSRMLENKLLEIPSLYKYQELIRHADAPDYSKRISVPTEFPTFDYHDSAPDYSSTGGGW